MHIGNMTYSGLKADYASYMPKKAHLVQLLTHAKRLLMLGVMGGVCSHHGVSSHHGILPQL